MPWDDEKVRRFEKYAAGLREKRLARTRQLVRAFAVVVVLGLGAIAFDVITRSKVPRIRVDFIDQAGTIAEWKHTGFIKSIDDTSLAIVVDETTWQNIPGDRRIAIASLLREYYSQANRGRSNQLVITGHLTGKTFATIAIAVEN